eukprot:4930912-Amphidinium_carterae.1
MNHITVLRTLQVTSLSVLASGATRFLLCIAANSEQSVASQPTARPSRSANMSCDDVGGGMLLVRRRLRARFLPCMTVLHT